MWRTGIPCSNYVACIFMLHMHASCRLLPELSISFPSRAAQDPQSEVNRNTCFSKRRQYSTLNIFLYDKSFLFVT